MLRFRLVRYLVPLLLLAVVIAFVFIWRARSRESYGPAVALCPGPDRYGYTCESAAAYAYVDATTPTGLAADDAVVAVELPFVFTFYGAEYDNVTISSNGNLQFTTGSPLAFPSCLAPVAGLGDLISPYWADLDFTLHGALETAVIGEAPARVFVVEWDDVPLYGADADDRVTVEAQLYEGSNDIVFLYQDATTTAAGNGGRAVVGLQSEAQRLSLSFSCLQPVLPTSGGLRFPHPAEPNPDAGEIEEAGAAAPAPVAPLAKGPVADLIAAYATRGPAVLDGLRQHWLSATPPQAFGWQAADLTGDGRDELVAIWRGPADQPQIARAAVLSTDDRRLEPLFDQGLSTREAAFSDIVMEATADLTGDGGADVVLRDRPTGHSWVLTAATGAPALHDLPGDCRGGLIVVKEANRSAVIRDGCDAPGRVRVAWDGQEFREVTGD